MKELERLLLGTGKLIMAIFSVLLGLGILLVLNLILPAVASVVTYLLLTFVLAYTVAFWKIFALYVGVIIIYKVITRGA